MLCYAMLCYAKLCYAMLCYAMLCYATLCYVMLCYVMLCYVMLWKTTVWWLINEASLLLIVLEAGGQRSGANMLGSCESPPPDVSGCFLSVSSCNRKKER